MPSRLHFAELGFLAGFYRFLAGSWRFLTGSPRFWAGSNLKTHGKFISVARAWPWN